MTKQAISVQNSQENGNRSNAARKPLIRSASTVWIISVPHACALLVGAMFNSCWFGRFCCNFGHSHVRFRVHLHRTLGAPMCFPLCIMTLSVNAVLR
jgi:hypothetical protein